MPKKIQNTRNFPEVSAAENEEGQTRIYREGQESTSDPNQEGAGRARKWRDKNIAQEIWPAAEKEEEQLLTCRRGQESTAVLARSALEVRVKKGRHTLKRRDKNTAQNADDDAGAAGGRIDQNRGNDAEAAMNVGGEDQRAP